MMRAEPTIDHFVATIAEKVIARLDAQKRLGTVISFNEAARILGEVLLELEDAGEYISDDVCRQLVGLPEVVAAEQPVGEEKVS